MGKIAIVFSGQGAQYPGMGKSLYQSSSAAKYVFDMCEKLRPGTLECCFEGTKEELSQTINTQPCLYALDLAAGLALSECGINADFAAGFSLGELAAAAYTGMVSYEDGFKLVCKRAEYMESCAKDANGGMVAVLGLGEKIVGHICSKFKNAFPANYNCPGQIVVSVGEDELFEFCEMVKSYGGKARRLAVSGAFHSPFVQRASEMFYELLKDYRLDTPKIPLFSNVTALPYYQDYKNLLAIQIKSPVLWQNTVVNIHDCGADIFIEAGAGKVLSGLISKTLKDVLILNVEDAESLKQTVSAVKGVRAV
jgi:[acyl-carrier-protein] S-malonyltransferase